MRNGYRCEHNRREGFNSLVFRENFGEYPEETNCRQNDFIDLNAPRKFDVDPNSEY